MTVYDIMGNELVSVPVTPKCERVQELMRTDCVKLSWVSEESTKLPAGAYVEYEGEHFTLLNDYSPVPRTEREYAYEPVFESVVMEWTKVPFFMYNANTKESDWTLTASPSVFLERVALALREETGKTYSIATSIGGSTSLQFSSTDIFSALNSIAQAFNTEWWLDKTTNTLHLGSCEHGETITLKVGENVGAPSVSESSEGFYNRFYVFGSTRNIVQSYEGANVNNLVNKRLTLDPSEFPNGYYEPYGSQPKVFSKILVFDDIYPAATNLKVVDLVARTAYNLDDNGNKKQIGTDSNGNAIYDQYTTWFFKAALEKEDGSYEDFIYNDWTYTEDSSVENGRQGMKIAGLVPSVKFESGLLMGREFEVTYYSKNTTISTTEGSIVVPAGFFGINYVKEGDYIIPDQFSLFPTEGDKVVFFNIKMPDIYITDAYARLKEKMLSTIQEKYLSDQNQYTLRSYPHAFNESVSVGSKVKYIWGGRELNTRVTALVNRLDYPTVKEITIGNTLIKGTIQQLIDETASANMNLEIMANMNAMTSSLANAYDRAHQTTLEMLNSLGDLFAPHYDKDGKLESIEAKVSLWSNGEITALGQGTGGSGGGGGEGGDDWKLDMWLSIAGDGDSFRDYQVNASHLTAYLTRAQIQETYATKEDLENIDIPTLTESDPIFKASAAYGITSTDISNWNSKTSNVGTITGIKMNGVSKGTSGEVDLGTVITEHQSLADYAKKTYVDTAISNLINGAPTTLDTLKEIADAFAQSQDVIEALDEAIGKKANQSDLTALSGRVDTLSGNLQGYAGDLQNVREDVDGIMADYITQSELDSAIAGVTGGGGSLGNRIDSLEAAVGVLEGYVPDDIEEGDSFATQDWVLGKNYALKSDIPTIPSLEGYATQQWVLDRGYLTSASLDALEQAIDNNATDIGDHENRIITIEGSYAKKNDIPTSLSDLANDVGYITASAIPTSYAWSAITGKPNTLGGYGITDAVALQGVTNDLMSYGNEFNFASAAYSGQLFINWRTGSTLLDGNISEYNFLRGAGRTYAALVAGSYVVYGGAPSQFLKADGSLDGTAYLPLSGGILRDSWSGGTEIRRADNNNGYVKLSFSQSNGTIMGGFGFGGIDNPLFITSAGGYNTLIHSGNIGSQSVNYANSAGALTTSGNIAAQANSNRSVFFQNYITFDTNASYGIYRGSYVSSKLGATDLYISAQNAIVLEGGKVGIGTQTPQYDLHVDGTMYGNLRMLTPRTIWGQSFDGTGNVSGSLTGTNFLIMDRETNTYLRLTDSYNTVYFQIVYGNAYIGSTSSKSLMVDGEGNVGIGTNSPERALDVVGDIGATGNVVANRFYGRADNSDRVSPTDQLLVLQSEGSGMIARCPGIGFHLSGYAYSTIKMRSNGSFGFYNNLLTGYVDVQCNNIIAEGEVTALGSSSSSDIRLKDIVSRPAPLTLEDIAKLNVISFKWNHRENDKRLKIGLVAQEVQEILPELVGVDRSNYLTLDYSTFGSVVGVMNTKKILSLEEEVIALRDEVKELRRKIYG